MNQKSKIGISGIVVGSMALLLALVHFWGGPFSPQPTIETVVATKAASIRQAAISALKGEPVEEVTKSAKWDLDRVAYVASAVLGGIALILAVLSLVKHESKFAAGGAALLGLGAIVFQFVAMYAMAFLVVILIVAVLSGLGVS